MIKIKSKLLTIVLVIVLVAAASIISFSVARQQLGSMGAKGGDEGAEWTVMFYFDGDNNLGEYKQFLFNLECLKKVGSTEDVNLVALIDRQTDGDSKVYYIKSGNLTEIPLNEVDTNWTDEVNMGDPDTLVSFVSFCADRYPAKHYNLKLSNHGGGWRGVCWDDTNSEDHLDLPEIEDALLRIDAVLGQKVDILSTEACLVGMAEFAYQIRNCAQYYVGSEAYSFGGEMYDDGRTVVGNWVYDKVYGRLVADPEMTPEAFAMVMIEEFNTYGPWSAPPSIPKTQSSDTLSVFNLSMMDELAARVDAFAGVLLDRVSGPSPGQNLNREAVINAIGLDELPDTMNTESFSGQMDFIGISTYTNYDLFDLCERIQTSRTLRITTEAQAVMDMVGSVIVAEHHGTDSSQGEHPDAHGIAIYLPYRNTEYNADYEQIAFSKDTQWDEFITTVWILPTA